MSSSDYSDRLDELLRGSGYVECVTDLEGDDLVWLVDYLDKVCSFVVLLHLH